MTLNRAQSWRWGACFALAFGIHAAGAVALVAKWNEGSDLAANAPLIMIDFAPVAAAPEATRNDLPPDQVASRQEDPEPEPTKPVEKVELPPPQAQAPDVTLPPPKKSEKRAENKPKQKSVARAPSAADRHAERAAAPSPGASGDSNATPNWRSQLVSRLERYKRYPPEAQSRGETGVAQLAFSIDRSGGVHNARIVHSSGSSLLDRETLALVERAQPLPPPPPEVSGSQIAIMVPIRYNVR
jgi:protein TonB